MHLGQATARVLEHPERSPALESFLKSRTHHRVGGTLLGGMTGALLGLQSQVGLGMCLVGAGGIVVAGSLLYTFATALSDKPAVGVGVSLAGVGLLAALALSSGNPLHVVPALAAGAAGAAAGLLMGGVVANNLRDPRGQLRREEQDYRDAMARYAAGPADMTGGGLQESQAQVTVGGVRLPKRDPDYQSNSGLRQADEGKAP